jgi:hypothetical protein
MSTTTRDAELRRIAEEAVRRAEGSEGWRAYEAAKSFVRREYPGLRKEEYDAVINAIKDRLEI